MSAGGEGRGRGPDFGWGPGGGPKNQGRDLERAASRAGGGFRLPPAALASRCIFLAPPPPPRRPPAHSWALGGLVLGMPPFHRGARTAGRLQDFEEVPMIGALRAPPSSFSQRNRGRGGWLVGMRSKRNPGAPSCLPTTVRPPRLEPEPPGPSKLSHTWVLGAGGCPATLRHSWVFEVPFCTSLSPPSEPWLNVPTRQDSETSKVVWWGVMGLFPERGSTMGAVGR